MRLNVLFLLYVLYNYVYVCKGFISQFDSSMQEERQKTPTQNSATIVPQ